MNHSISKYLLTKSSLFTSTEYKIEASKLLSISSVSPFDTKNDSIPLELINPEPLIENKVNKQLLLASVLAFVSTLSFYQLSENLTNPLFTNFSAILLTFSILFIFLSSRNKTKLTTFFFVNTHTKIFSLKQLNSKSETIDQNQVFIETLSKKIHEKNITVLSSNTDDDHMLNTKLDELYNYGILDNVLYERIQKNIHEKIYGVKESKPLADVITLETRRIST